MTAAEGFLRRPAPPPSPAAPPIDVPAARRSPWGEGPWRHLWPSAKFAALTLLMAVAALALLDWVLFETPAVAARLPVDSRVMPSEKLLLAARYRDANVLYLGDSRILYGVDPARVSETCGCGPGYNAAVPAADPRLDAIMADRLLRRLSPKVVVIGLSQWELSDAAEIRHGTAAVELVAPWRLDEFDVHLGPAEQAQAALGAVWGLFRYRGEVRAALDPATPRVRHHERRRGYHVYDDRRRLSKKDFDAREEQWFTDFSVEGRRTEALRALLADLRARGLRVVLVAPPFHPDFHDRVRAEVRAFRAAATQLAAEHGAGFIDLTRADRIKLTSGHFRDIVHLDEAGAARLSRALGTQLKAYLAAG